jgi:uncharacterized membrane protein
MRAQFSKLFWSACLFVMPFFLFGQSHSAGEQDGADAIPHNVPSGFIYEGLEWVEFIVDLFGIMILIIGFVKGVYVFIKWEIDKFRGGDVYDDIMSLRSTLGWYIILALDFLIISDIMHSIIKPEFNDLINLGIIVVLRTSIGFFLGKELMELRHAEKEDKEKVAAEKVVEHVQ